MTDISSTRKWLTILRNLVNGFDLSYDETAFAMKYCMNNDVDNSQISAFSVLLKQKPTTLEEFNGLVDALSENSIKFPVKRDNLFDIVGTGGDGKNYFNLSTMSAIVAASVGMKILKHGGRASSSISGSIDTLEKLGVNLNCNSLQIEACLDEVGIAYSRVSDYQPFFHKFSTMRQNLKVPTIFNLLGPLSNPGETIGGLIGCTYMNIFKCYADFFAQKNGTYAVIRGQNGSDEIIPSNKTDVLLIKDHEISAFTFDPKFLGMSQKNDTELIAKNLDEVLNVFVDVIHGSGDKNVRDAVILNSTFLLTLDYLHKLDSLDSNSAVDYFHDQLIKSFDLVSESLDSGNAGKTFDKWVEVSNSDYKL